MAHARDWGTRAGLELQEHPNSMFLTLTYASEHLPEYQTLDVRTLQLFMKRLRKHVSYVHDTKLRFLASGEYGGRTGRPHYHALIYGYSFDDLLPFTKSGANVLYLSEKLSQLWPYGRAYVAPVSQNAPRVGSYIAGYSLKKLQNEETRVDLIDHETGEVLSTNRRSEFITMSRRPGIGMNWVDTYATDLEKGFVTIDGQIRRIPKAFYRYLKKANPDFHKRLTDQARVYSLSKVPDPETRLWARHQLGLDRMQQLSRDKEL